MAASGQDEKGRGYTTAISSRRAALPALPLLLRAKSPRAHPNPCRLSEGSCVLGAGHDADLVIESDTISRRHAELRLVPEGVAVTDLGSKNGSYYLGQRFTSMVLGPGTRFQIGSIDIEIEIDHETLTQREVPPLGRYGDLLGGSPAMRQLFSQLVRLEGSTVNVLIAGESGTGKELIARAIHEHSTLRGGPFVAINCGALERSLVRSELFGNLRGAFTGATERRIGAFEAADGGTLLLDEIGELPLDVQPVLLRALELRMIAPLGSHVEKPVHVRVLAATHRDLEAEVAAGHFRQDLFYRIQVVRIDVPPLRKRPEDVALLAEAFACAQGVRSLPADFLEALQQHAWPGNGRELRNAVEAYLAIGALPRSTRQAGTGLEAALASFVDPTQSYAQQKEDLAQRFTRAYLAQLMQHTAGNQSEAARLSGLDRTYLGKLLKKLGLRQP